jgi:hypothetical protein
VGALLYTVAAGKLPHHFSNKGLAITGVTMPKELTHWMLAERALDGLPKGSRVGEIIAGHRGAYLGGAVLPDTLAHLGNGPNQKTARRLGQRFHDTPGNSFLPLINAERRFPEGLPPALFSCFLGVISHMEADVALHPYVYAATGAAGIGEHYRLETAIDVRFLREGNAPAPRRLARLLDSETREVLVSATGLLFDPDGELPRRALERSLQLHCRYQSMYDRTFWKMAVRLLARFRGAQFREQRHLFYPLRRSNEGMIAELENGWCHPETGELKGASLDDLARQAVERTVQLFLHIEAKGTLAAALTSLPGANLLTGLHGVKKDAGS